MPLALVTIAFDARDVETARWMLAIGILVLVCLAIYSTWPKWSWEKR